MHRTGLFVLRGTLFGGDYMRGQRTNTVARVDIGGDRANCRKVSRAAVGVEAGFFLGA